MTTYCFCFYSDTVNCFWNIFIKINSIKRMGSLETSQLIHKLVQNQELDSDNRPYPFGQFSSIYFCTKAYLVPSHNFCTGKITWEVRQGFKDFHLCYLFFFTLMQLPVNTEAMRSPLAEIDVFWKGLFQDMRWYHNFLSQIQNTFGFFARFPETHRESCYECLKGLAVGEGDVKNWNFTATIWDSFPYADL